MNTIKEILINTKLFRLIRTYQNTVFTQIVCHCEWFAADGGVVWSVTTLYVQYTTNKKSERKNSPHSDCTARSSLTHSHSHLCKDKLNGDDDTVKAM